MTPPPTLSAGTIGAVDYGCDHLGRLESVMLHTPGEALGIIDSLNHHQWLFDQVPDIERYADEHCRYRELLESHGVKVYELGDHVKESAALLPSLPNLTFLHDTAVVSGKGAMLSVMASDARRKEEVVVREALTNLGIPILHEFTDREDAFEGCLLLNEDTLLVCDTERHSMESIRKFIHAMSDSFGTIIYVMVPKARRFMHPDTLFNRIRKDLALCFLPGMKETFVFQDGRVRRVGFAELMNEMGVELVNVSDKEQRNLACSFVPLESGVIFHYDTALTADTIRTLEQKGVELILFHPDAMRAGGGSLRCHTLRLRREPC